MTDWIPVGERMPETLRPVLATVHNGGGRAFVIRAGYAPKFTVEERGYYEGDPDYHEERDCYYWPEGWYEWNECEETHWQVNGEVLAWMQMPDAYKETP